MKISDQALGAIMMALQKSLLEQSDIVPVLKEFDFQVNDKEELVVSNPPTVKFDKTGSDENLQVFQEEETRNTVGSD